jgi:sugar porter (SP) family MFS transporter
MKLYLILVCLIAAVGGFLFGFDTSVISGAIEFIQSPHVFNLNDIQKGWAVSSIIIGCMIGCVLIGKPSQVLGRKKMLLFTAFVFLISTLGCSLANSFKEFIVFRILAGVAVGSASVLAPVYISEISPPNWRGRMVSFNQLATFTGQALAFVSNNFLYKFHGIDNWRYMLGIMVIPSGLFAIFLFFIPESPRWLIIKNKNDKALNILTKISGEETAHAVFDGILLNVKGTVAGQFKELFRGKMFKLMVIGILLAVFQQITGINVIMYYSPAIFKSTGAGNESALFQTMIMGLVNLTFTIVSILLIERMGRRLLMLIGSAGMGLFLFAISGAYFTHNFEGYLVLIFIMGYLAFFALSLGPIVWVLIGEIFPNRLRSQASALAVFCLWGSNFIISFTFPILLKNLNGGFTFLIYAIMCILCLVFVYKYLIETKGKTLEQIEMDFLGEGFSGKDLTADEIN